MLKRIVDTESPYTFDSAGVVLPAVIASQWLDNLHRHCKSSSTTSNNRSGSKGSTSVPTGSKCRGSSQKHQCTASLALAQETTSSLTRRGFLAVGEQAQNIGAGAAARTLSQVVIHPLDTIKTRLQVTAQVPRLQAWQQTVASTGKRLQSGPVISLKGSSSIMAASRSIGDLYLGLASAVITTLPAAAVFFATSEACKQGMEKHFKCDRKGMLCHMVSSSAAAVASAFIRVPGDVLKHRIQAYMLPSNVAVSCRQVLLANGLKGMYVGFGVTLMRDVPEIAIQFTVYDTLLRTVQQMQQQQGESLTGEQHQSERQQAILKAKHPLALGGLAGAVAAVLTTPLDVIKTQLQCDGVSNANMAVQGVLARKGPAGFVAGMGPRVMQATLMSSVFFAFYERLKSDLAASRSCEHLKEEAEARKQQQQQQQHQRRSELIAPSSPRFPPQTPDGLLFSLAVPLLQYTTSPRTFTKSL